MLREIYHKSPAPVESVIKKLHSKIPFYGLKFTKYYKFVIGTQWRSLEELVGEIPKTRWEKHISEIFNVVTTYFTER